MQQVPRGAVTGILSFQLIKDTEANNRGGIILPIAEGVGGRESWNNFKFRTQSSSAHLVHLLLIHILGRRLALKLLCWSIADRGRREQGLAYKTSNLAQYLKFWREARWNSKVSFPHFLIHIGLNNSPRNKKLEYNSKIPKPTLRHHVTDRWRHWGKGELKYFSITNPTP